MKKRKKVYCEMDFLLDFICNPPSAYNFEDNSEDCWRGLGKFLQKSDLVLNVTKEDLFNYCGNDNTNADEERKNAFLKCLIRKSCQGEISLSFIDDYLSVDNISEDYLEDSALNAVFLTTSDSKTCQEISRNYGLIVLNKDDVLKSIHLFKDSGIAFPSGNSMKWDFLNALNIDFPQLKCCNSMLIVDNYICSDSLGYNNEVIFSYQDKIKFNLEPIFKALLPEELACGLEYEISVFTGNKKDENLENQYNYIYSLISKIRPYLKFSVTLYNNVSKVFHDRTIVTNNVWISCLAGFDVFDRKGTIRKPTNVNVLFLFFSKDINWTDDAFGNFVKSANKVIERYKEPGRNIWGNTECKNRIISYYTSGETENDSIVQRQVNHGNQIGADRFSRSNSWG